MDATGCQQAGKSPKVPRKHYLPPHMRHPCGHSTARTGLLNHTRTLIESTLYLKSTLYLSVHTWTQIEIMLRR